jgi:Leucine-rich repeat (LRR) protein
VKVIVCGYRERTGIHPDYVRIAYETGGSIHTIEDDIYNILIETDNKGVITGIVDSDIKVSTSLGSYTSKYRVTINPEQVFTDIDSAIAHKNYVQKLDLTSKAYDKVPKQISRFKKLRYLDLSDNNIDNINYIVCGREKLLELRMANNKIKKIPKRIEKLMLLKVIDLSDNLIDTICPEFMSLRQLEYCDLSGNQIRYIPRMNFRKLKYLYLDDNQLAVIPSYLGIMKNLVELSLSGNYLKQIPKKIGYLKKLEVLDLSDNNITSLPNSFVKLKALRMLRISGNQISKEEFERIREMLPNTTIEYN